LLVCGLIAGLDRELVLLLKDERTANKDYISNVLSNATIFNYCAF
jgi:hypothetical protein